MKTTNQNLPQNLQKEWRMGLFEFGIVAVAVFLFLLMADHGHVTLRNLGRLFSKKRTSVRLPVGLKSETSRGPVPNL